MRHPYLSFALMLTVGAVQSARTTVVAPDPVAGDYTLIRAGGHALPYAFTADLGAGEMKGTLTGARLTLHPDGSYDADLDVKVDPGVLANIPGMPADLAQTLHDKGQYTVQGTQIVLQAEGMLTKRYDAVLSGRVAPTGLAFNEATLRSKSQRYAIDLGLQRAR